MESKIKIAATAVLLVAIVLATVAIATAAYVASRQNQYQAAYGNYAPYGGYGSQGSYSQVPYEDGYPQSGYGYNSQPGYGNYGGDMMGRGGMMGGW